MICEPQNSLYIASIGARTSAGLSAKASAAAVRAGIVSARDHDFLIDKTGTPILGAIDSILDSDMHGPSRFVALAKTALTDLSENLKQCNLLGFRIPLYLALPELRPGFSMVDVDEIVSSVSELCEPILPVSEVKPIFEGHAGGVFAIFSTIESLQEKGGEMFLVGGIDSYFAPSTIAWLDRNQQLFAEDARSSFIPGEGAAFLLLATKEACDRYKLSTSLRIATVGIASEVNTIKSDNICIGEGLTNALKDALPTLPQGEFIDDIFCDITGERYRSEEWAFASLKLAKYFGDVTDYRSPAECWGDVGAASIPLFAMLAGEAFKRDYALGRYALLWASSERGLRGAVVLESLSHDF